MDIAGVIFFNSLCVLSLVFVAKCSLKLGELPAGVRGMDIAGCYLFQVRFSQLFGGQKVAKSPGRLFFKGAGFSLKLLLKAVMCAVFVFISSVTS